MSFYHCFCRYVCHFGVFVWKLNGLWSIRSVFFSSVRFGHTFFLFLAFVLCECTRLSATLHIYPSSQCYCSFSLFFFCWFALSIYSFNAFSISVRSFRPVPCAFLPQHFIHRICHFFPRPLYLLWYFLLVQPALHISYNVCSSRSVGRLNSIMCIILLSSPKLLSILTLLLIVSHVLSYLLPHVNTNGVLSAIHTHTLARARSRKLPPIRTIIKTCSGKL